MKSIAFFRSGMKKIAVLIIVLTVFSACKKNTKEEPIVAETPKNEIVEHQQKSDSPTIKFEIVDKHVPIKKVVYLKKDVRAMATPTDDVNESLTAFKYLYLCSVIDEVDEWYGILDSVCTEEFTDKENDCSIQVYRKVYIRKDATAPISDYKLTKEDFAIFTNESSKGDEVSESVSDDVMTFDLITQDEYEKQKKYSKDFVNHDTLSIRKTNGVLKLPCRNKTLTLKDQDGIDAEPDNIYIYTYIGKIDLLNAYLVYVEFFEEDGYNLYDRNTGKLLLTLDSYPTFDSYPIISSDKKYLATVYVNPFDFTSDFSLYQLTDGMEIRPYYNFSFRKWSPYGNTTNHNNVYFWGRDNNIYVKTINMDISGIPYLDLNEAVQYIRIKIK